LPGNVGYAESPPNRGVDGRQLFCDDHANEHFPELLESMSERFGLRIHVFVLMGNHYHLQIETLKPELTAVSVASARF
jgi:hypothetical protein